MERIKVAVEKARKQGLVDSPAHRSPVAVATTGAESGEFVDINYSQTDIVELDREHLKNHRILAYDKDNQSSWMFDILRTQVLQKMEENGWRTLAITSPNPEAGKTVVSINLAMSIAHQTQRTAMLVDFDLRRPKVKTYLGLKREKSLNDVLAGDIDISEAMVNPNIPRLVILPTNKPVAKSSEVLSSKRVESIITDLRERYSERVVIFDLPPILAADDAIAVLPKIDCVLLVIGNGMSNQREIEDCMRHIPEANLLGVVLNKSEMPTRTYYY